MSAAHVALWTVQLVKDHRQTTGQIALVYAWKESKFIYGWIVRNYLSSSIVLSF
jgi:hypothetical protein